MKLETAPNVSIAPAQDAKHDGDTTVVDAERPKQNIPVPSNQATEVEPYAHPKSRMTVALHDAGHAFTATGLYAGDAEPGHEKAEPS